MNDQDSIDRIAAHRAAAALATLHRRQSAVIRYQSRGRLLLIGDAVATAAANVPDALQATLISREAAPLDVTPALTAYPATREQLSLSGHLGAFQLSIVAATRAEFTLEADLVLDLSVPPLLDGRLAPPGYRAPANTPQDIAQALTELAELVGVFEKPDYFHYDPQLCAHQRNGVTACQRCLDACPTQAIRSSGGQIAVDANLCQGLGSCAAVCPSGAIRYAYPGLEDSLTAWRLLLRSYREAGGATPRLLIHDGDEGQQWLTQAAASLPGNVLTWQVEEVSSLGIDAWLSALAFGASDLTVLVTPTLSDAPRAALEQQAEIAVAFTDGMGYGAECIRLCQASDSAGLIAAFATAPAGDGIPPATHALADNKRDMLFWAIDHLYAHATARRPLISLPPGAPFGTAEVDPKACTLCLSCVSACPGQALQDGYDTPQLRFIESQCLQCGMCTRTCPENAIWITPRFLFTRQQRQQPRILHEEPAFACVQCGKPFATHALINHLLGKLAGHGMFQSQRALRRVQMCADCRVFDAVQDPQAMPDSLQHRPPS
jgi:ferredoxin